MTVPHPLPSYLVQRFKNWQATGYQENKVWLRHLAHMGQSPRAMIISCCDSRMQVSTLFGADQGEFFIHRNVANLVPPFNPDNAYHGTSAAIEYAVRTLQVPHIIILGHSNCGGVKGCLDMCSGDAPELEENDSFIGRWMDILRPAYEKVKELPPEQRFEALEKEAVLVGLENLMTFPFIEKAVTDERLTLHGLWHDIGEGVLKQYESDQKEFVIV